MNEEHITIFDYNKTSNKYDNYYDSMQTYKIYKSYNIYYMITLNIIYSSFYLYNNDIDIYIDLSIILYKLHNSNYYRKYNHKELI